MAGTAKRRERLAIIRRYKRQGLTSQEIGQRTGIAPSTVRDYLTDPRRERARSRQRQLGVTGVTNPSGVYPVTKLKASGWKRGGPHRGRGAENAATRGRQVRALIGYYAGRG
jgi:hypothetical protein